MELSLSEVLNLSTSIARFPYIKKLRSENATLIACGPFLLLTHAAFTRPLCQSLKQSFRSEYNYWRIMSVSLGRTARCLSCLCYMHVELSRGDCVCRPCPAPVDSLLMICALMFEKGSAVWPAPDSSREFLEHQAVLHGALSQGLSSKPDIHVGFMAQFNIRTH